MMCAISTAQVRPVGVKTAKGQYLTSKAQREYEGRFHSNQPADFESVDQEKFCGQSIR